MNIPLSIKQAIPKNPMDNQAFYNADKMWHRLTDIYKKK